VESVLASVLIGDTIGSRSAVLDALTGGPGGPPRRAQRGHCGAIRTDERTLPCRHSTFHPTWTWVVSLSLRDRMACESNPPVSYPHVSEKCSSS